MAFDKRLLDLGCELFDNDLFGSDLLSSAICSGFCLRCILPLNENILLSYGVATGVGFEVFC